MRVSATQLESFRLYVEHDWMTEEALLESLSGTFTPTHEVKRGSAFGRILESPEQYFDAVSGFYLCDGFTFDPYATEDALRLLDYQRGVFEAKAVKVYGPHEVASKADYLLGAHLREFKTTESGFDFDKYESSCQWRFMADAFQPSRITYDIFRLKEDGYVEVVEVNSFDLYPYAGLHEGCARLVRQFAEYVEARGLAGLFNERQRMAVAF